MLPYVTAVLSNTLALAAESLATDVRSVIRCAGRTSFLVLCTQELADRTTDYLQTFIFLLLQRLLLTKRHTHTLLLLLYY